MDSAAAAVTPLRTILPARDYDLAATLSCGQAFRWQQHEGAWEGVVGAHSVRLALCPGGIQAETAAPVRDWGWLRTYLQSDVDLAPVLLSFPDDAPMRLAVTACRGLRLLRQEPWECLASFILSSTKQIVQIRQIIALLCERFGQPLVAPPGHSPAHSFPTAARLAACSESELRACKMGFRAPHLRAAARAVAGGQTHLRHLLQRPVGEARAGLMQLRGVGRKIADCVLLFAGGQQQAFPIDVWVMKALRQLYFPKRRATLKRLEEFSATHFGPNAGYAQQYLFHYMRLQAARGRTRRAP